MEGVGLGVVNSGGWYAHEVGLPAAIAAPSQSEGLEWRNDLFDLQHQQLGAWVVAEWLSRRTFG